MTRPQINRRIVVLLPVTHHFALGGRGDTDIGARGELVREETGTTSRGNGQNGNNGIGGNVRQPTVLKRGLGAHVFHNGRRRCCRAGHEAASGNGAKGWYNV